MYSANSHRHRHTTHDTDTDTIKLINNFFQYLFISENYTTHDTRHTTHDTTLQSVDFLLLFRTDEKLFDMREKRALYSLASGGTGRYITEGNEKFQFQQILIQLFGEYGVIKLHCIYCNRTRKYIPSFFVFFN